jgi:hypothetical protein
MISSVLETAGPFQNFQTVDGIVTGKEKAVPIDDFLQVD